MYASMRWIAAARRCFAVPAPLRGPLSAGLLLIVGAWLLMVAVTPLRATLQISVSLVLIGGGLALVRWLPRARFAALLLCAVASLRYLYWRATETIAWEASPDGVLAGLLLATEAYGFLVCLGGAWQASVRKERAPRLLRGRPEDLPAVDVLVPTFNEGVDILRRTLTGAVSIRWPRKEVYVLDDGRRPEVEALAAELGCRYLVRPDNRGAKAGNLNAALARTDAPFVAIFDADHVPVRTFLETTMGFFQEDDRVALVQTPHHFYNPDPFLRNLHMEGRAPPEQA